MPDDRDQWIAARAYALWEQEGKPYGRNDLHWNQAARERDRLELTRASADGSDVLARKAENERAAKDAAAASGVAVLVVEDEAELRFDAVETFEAAGFRTYEAESAEKAISILNGSKVGTLYTDVRMPGAMDGLGLASKVRLLWPRTQIIVASGMIRLARKDLARGMHFLPKPVPLSNVLDLIRNRHISLSHNE